MRNEIEVSIEELEEKVAPGVGASTGILEVGDPLKHQPPLKPPPTL